MKLSEANLNELQGKCFILHKGENVLLTGLAQEVSINPEKELQLVLVDYLNKVGAKRVASLNSGILFTKPMSELEDVELSVCSSEQVSELIISEVFNTAKTCSLTEQFEPSFLVTQDRMTLLRMLISSGRKEEIAEIEKNNTPDQPDKVESIKRKRKSK